MAEVIVKMRYHFLALIFFVSVLFFVSSCDIQDVQYSADCGQCTPWESVGCGPDYGCEEGEMKQSRQCTGDIFSDERPARAGGEIPLSPPEGVQFSLGDVPPSCIKACVPHDDCPIDHAIPPTCEYLTDGQCLEDPESPNTVELVCEQELECSGYNECYTYPSNEYCGGTHEGEFGDPSMGDCFCVGDGICHDGTDGEGDYGENAENSLDCQECVDGTTDYCDSGLPGICADGLVTCEGSNWGDCVANINPGDYAEDCDDSELLDEDCDGWANSNDLDCINPPECGDEIIEGDEVCECGPDQDCGSDDDDVNGVTCEDLGYAGGSLRCADCLSFYTGLCTVDEPVCGDGFCEPPEDAVSCPEDCESTEICDNGIDDDEDGLIDCNDIYDCLGDPACAPEEDCELNEIVHFEYSAQNFHPEPGQLFVKDYTRIEVIESFNYYDGDGEGFYWGEFTAEIVGPIFSVPDGSFEWDNVEFYNKFSACAAPTCRINGVCTEDEDCWNCPIDCGVTSGNYDGNCGDLSWAYNSYGSYGSACEHPRCFRTYNNPSSDYKGARKLVNWGTDQNALVLKTPYPYGESSDSESPFWEQYIKNDHINMWGDGVCPDQADLEECVSTGDRQFHNYVTWIYVGDTYMKVFDYTNDDSFSINVWNGCGVGNFDEELCYWDRDSNYLGDYSTGTGNWEVVLTKGWNVIEIMGFNDEGPATYKYSTEPFKDDPHVVAISSDGPMDLPPTRINNPVGAFIYLSTDDPIRSNSATLTNFCNQLGFDYLIDYGEGEDSWRNWWYTGPDPNNCLAMGDYTEVVLEGEWCLVDEYKPYATWIECSSDFAPLQGGIWNTFVNFFRALF